MLFAIPAAIGAAASLAGTLFGMTRGSPGVSSEEAAFRDWTRTIEPAGTMMNKLFYNPAYSGQPFPFAEKFKLPTNASTTQWAPTQSTQRLYNSYLNRQYGLPNRIARSMTAQAMLPMQYQRLGESPYNPAGARKAFQLDPQIMVKAQLERKAPEAIRQMEYLKGAAELAGFNLWRTQQVPRLIG